MSFDRGDEARSEGGAFAETASVDAPPLSFPSPAGASATPAVPALKRIAFCGFWEVTRDMAPDPGAGWEIWGCNHGYPFLKKGPDGQPHWDVWMDLHDPAWSAKHHPPEVWADMERFLKTRHGKPIYMQRHYEEYPDSVPFPRAEVEARFPVTSNRAFRRYNTNALTYAVSLALLHDVTDLAIYGADMRGSEEYATQRPAVEYWLGRAEGMGVRLTVPPESGLLNADGLDYGYDEETGAWVEMRRALEAEVVRAAEEKEKALAAAQTYDGFRQASLDMIRRVDQRRRGGGVL